MKTTKKTPVAMRPHERGNREPVAPRAEARPNNRLALNVNDPTARATVATNSDDAPKPKIGILAGWGEYPLVLAAALRKQGYDVYGLGIKDHADVALADLCTDFQWVGLAKLGHAIRFFRQRGVQQVTMAGKVHKVLLYQPWVWFKHLPDWRAVRRFHAMFLFNRKDRRDDTLLNEVIAEFAIDGIHFEPPTDFVPELLVKWGTLTRRGPSSNQRKDVEFGWQLAKEMGRLDIGQSVVIKGRTVIAVEAIEGTDQCILRAGQLCQAGGFTVVKVAKPQQDMRFDVPTIGMGTMRAIAEAGGRVLAIEAGRTIIVDEPSVVEFAQRHRISIVALHDEVNSSDRDAAEAA